MCALAIGGGCWSLLVIVDSLWSVLVSVGAEFSDEGGDQIFGMFPIKLNSQIIAELLQRQNRNFLNVSQLFLHVF